MQVKYFFHVKKMYLYVKNHVLFFFVAYNDYPFDAFDSKSSWYFWLFSSAFPGCCLILVTSSSLHKVFSILLGGYSILDVPLFKALLKKSGILKGRVSLLYNCHVIVNCSHKRKQLRLKHALLISKMRGLSHLA